ncbi:hypothetical protein [Vibrio splendidus]|nr:hypothetical protein [Vibrio splendidus]
MSQWLLVVWLAYLANLAVSWFQYINSKVDHDEQIEVIIILG